MFVAGCKRRTGCSNGWYCQTGVGEYECDGCSIDECEQRASSNNADAFEYNGPLKMCGLCTKEQLENRQRFSDWGVYTKTGTCSFMTILNESILMT